MRSGRRSAAAVACVLGLIVSACTTFGAAPEQADASAAAEDARAPSDGSGAEASAEGADAGRACATGSPRDAVFCSDFESETELPFGWTDTFDGDFEVVEGAGQGGSRALRVRATGAWLRRALPASPPPHERREWSFELAFRLVSSSATKAVIGGLWFTSPSASSEHGVALLAGGTLAGGSASGSPTLAMTPGWHVARVVLTGRGGQHERVVTIDGVEAERSLVDLRAFPFPDLRVGAYFTENATTPVELYIDDVVVRAR